MSLCKCGCGVEAKPGKKYIQGHQFRDKEVLKIIVGKNTGKKRTIATKQKMAVSAMKENRGPHSETTKAKMKESWKKLRESGWRRVHTEETKTKMRNTWKKRIESGWEKGSVGCSEETKEKLRLVWKKKSNDHKTKGKTLEEIYGLERAHDIKEKIRIGQLRSNKIGNVSHKKDCNCCVCRVQNGTSLKCLFMGVYFDSFEEKVVAELLFSYFGIVPINNVNCHVVVNGRIIDFYVFGCFIEYHPGVMFPRKVIENPEVYYKKRRNILDSNGFRKNVLIHLKNLKEVKELCKFLSIIEKKREESY